MSQHNKEIKDSIEEHLSAEPGSANVIDTPPNSEAMEIRNKDSYNSDDDTEDMYDDDDDNDDDEDEIEANEPTICLFCDHISNDIEPTAIAHLLTEHKVDLVKLKYKHNMDQYSFIKLINCIRKENTRPEDLLKSETEFWADEKYLKPADYEPWLTYDYDQLHDENTSGNDKQLANVLLDQLKEKSILLEQAYEDMKTIRERCQQALQTIKETPRKRSSSERNDGDGDDDGGAHSAYFNSYSHFGIHHEMLSDVVRTTSYRDALLKNKDFINGKTVLDVGCGTAVLSIFASKAGASEVVAVENSNIIQKAMGIVKNNNIENIKLVRGRLEDVDLPIEKFDIIISEWMGYFLIFEGMLDSIIYARKHLLKDDGLILPNRCTLSLVGYGNDDLFKRYIKFWDNVYDIDMSIMRDEVISEPLIDVVDAQYILTEPEMLADLNMATVELNYANITHNFNMTFKKDGNFSAFVGYFSTYFDLPAPIMFGTAPTDEPTHWKQVVFFLNQPQAVKAGETISVKFKCKRLAHYCRSLDIRIEVFNKQYLYHLD